MLEPARCAGPSGGLTRSCTGPRRVSEPYKSATGKKPIASDNAAFAPRSSLRIEGNSVTFDIDLWGGVMYRANLLARYSLLWGVCSSCGCLLGRGRAEHPLTRLPPTRAADCCLDVPCHTQPSQGHQSVARSGHVAISRQANCRHTRILRSGRTADL